ncbi:MAG: transglutaminase, partial [Candidatus Aenigmatarchaeota archaeon]
MDFRYKPAIRIISLIVLFFFCWTFGGIFDIAYAIKSEQPSAINSQQKENNQKSSQGSRPTKQKPEEKFQKTIEDIEKTLADTTTDTDTKKNKIKTKKSEIESLDIEIKKQFAGTEKKLKDEGLPGEILNRHYEFVTRYENNLNELKNNLDAIDKAKDKAETDNAIDKTKKFL